MTKQKPHIAWFGRISKWICTSNKDSLYGWSGDTPQEAYRLWYSWNKE